MYACDYSEDIYGTGMGLALPAVAAVAKPVTGVISSIGNVVSSIFGGNSKDKGRLEANARWFNECASGNQDACCAVKHMSGRFGLATCGVNGQASGWATSKAKDDAFAKYNTLLQAGAYATPASAASPTTSSAYPVTTQSSTLVPGVPATIGGMSTGPLMVAGIAALGLVLAMSNRR